MELERIVQALSALAQSTRLGVFRLLMKAGLKGLPAGAIAESAGVPSNTMSTHLAILARAGLVNSRRQSRSIIYSANLENISGVLSFLLEDCCGGHPEICAPLIKIAGNSCCPLQTKQTPRQKKRSK